MSRAERLLSLMQILRRHRFPVTGAALSKELGISLRSLYRDIAALQGQGARIDGESGIGYLLRPGFTLPPLNFTEEEIEALVLGSRWVERRTDARLARAARDAQAKIAAVLPPGRREEMELGSLRLGPSPPIIEGTVDLGLLRQAIRQERKLSVRYRDEKGRLTRRVLWPVALGYFDRVRVLAAWCELREGFRHFRADRMESAEILEEAYPRKRSELQRAWRAAQGMDAEE